MREQMRPTVAITVSVARSPVDGYAVVSSSSRTEVDIDRLWISTYSRVSALGPAESPS